MESYSLPIYKRSSFKWYWSLLFIVLIIFFTIGAGFFLFDIIKDDFTAGLFGGLFLLIIDIYFGYILIYAGILKRLYIEINPEYIEASLLHSTKKVYWHEIYDAGLYEYNHNIMIGILLKKDMAKKRKRSFANNFSSLYGIPSYSLQLPLRFFADIDGNRLFLTIAEQINKSTQETGPAIETIITDQEDETNSIFKAITSSIALCVFTSTFYAFIIYKIEKNYIVIPLLGSLLIISMFNKYYVEKSFNAGIRLFLGFLCLLQFPVGIIEGLLFASRLKITFAFVLAMSSEYFKYFFNNLGEQFEIIIFALICFGFGLLRGRTKRKNTP